MAFAHCAACGRFYVVAAHGGEPRCAGCLALLEPASFGQWEAARASRKEAGTLREPRRGVDAAAQSTK